MISQDIIEEIRQRADIVDVISTYINVIKKGNSYVAVCPFHNDKNPSLQISRTKQIYKCFSCSAGGNVFTFVQDFEKISFLDAVRKVASIIGYENKELDKPTRVVSDETKDVLFALKSANEFYSYVLNTQEGSSCLDYLKNRNIEDEMIEYFQLGFSPVDGESSIKMLRAKNISIEALDKAGIIQRNNNQFIDRFKGRLIFPLFNEFGDVVGYSARRIVDNDEAKYVNSTNTIVFNKSKILYNYQNASKEAKKAGYVYITEGFMDVFSLYKVGIKSSVAIMGTAFTEHHAKLIKKLNVEARLCLDGDDPGQHGILQMIPLLVKEGVSVKVVNYKDCKLDPDEILQKYGKDNLFKFLNRLISKEEFIFAYYLKRTDISTLEGKKDFANQIINYLKEERDPVVREITLKKLSDLTQVSVDSYNRILSSFSEITEEEVIETSPVRNTVVVTSRYQKIQQEIIRLMLNYQEAIEDYDHGRERFIDKIYDDLACYIIDYYLINKNIDISNFITFLSQTNDPNYKELMEKVMNTQDIDIEVPEYTNGLMKEYLDILSRENKKNEIYSKLNDPFNGKSVEEQAQLLQGYANSRRK